MKANELRINNYVRDPYDGVIKLLSVESDASMLRPIPLTEEWLLKFGFDLKREDDARWYEYEFDYNRLRLTSNDIGKNGFSNKLELVFLEDIDCNVFVKSIKHVHQLQNLYFALTGKELKTIKQ